MSSHRPSELETKLEIRIVTYKIDMDRNYSYTREQINMDYHLFHEKLTLGTTMEYIENVVAKEKNR